MSALPKDLPSEFADVVGIRIICDDCGRKSYWPPSKVRDAEKRGFKTVQALGSRFRCHVCTARGGSGRNVSLRVVIKGEP